MVDAVISTVVIRLTPVIADRVRNEVNLVLNSQKEAKNLVSTLKMIQKLLEDAEKKRIADRRVKEWLEKIEDAAYEMDDALDEWEMKNIELEMEGSNVFEIFREKVSSFINSLCLCFQHSIERRHIALKIKELNGRLESIAKENDEKFKILPNVSEEMDLDDDSQAYIPPKTSSLVDVPKVKGRDYVKNILVSKLLSEGSEQGKDNIQIIGLVGPGGLGKTTVAQLVFNDSQVEKHFPSKTWVCVSDPFDRLKIAKEILRSLKVDFRDDDAFETLVQLIKSSVAGERFLLVLDDVWTEDEKKLTDLKLLLSTCAHGSRILVTTRKDRVAKMMGAQIQTLHLLSDSDCWSVMSQKAFLGGKKENHEILESIGRKIAAKRCRGLPLAAITLGSLLYEKDTMEGWEAVLNDEVWNLDIARKEIFPPIHLSYRELDLPLKRCFSYCAIFPKDSVMEANTLIRMWMAHGFLSGGSAEKMEQKGRDYLNKLVALSFFQEIKDDDIFYHVYKMHDIIHDFVQYVTEGECFSLEFVDDEVVAGKEEYPNARHLSWQDNRKASSKPVLNCNFEKLRSFLSNDYDCLPPAGLGTLKCVRTLNLSHCGLQKLSPEIGNLIHLRYLDLTDNHLIKDLPISLCHLYKLQTLILEGMHNLRKLPEEIYKLKELRHLLVHALVTATFFPQGFEKLTGLGTLNIFSAGSNLGYLKDLNQLEGKLEIIIDDANVIEARNAELKNKNRLRSLRLDFRGEVRMDVMEALEPPPKLSRLELEGFGVEFPRWINTTSLNNLKTLLIDHSSSLPPLGNLQSLENLYVWSNKMNNLGREFLGITYRRAFPKLKVLEFIACPGWIRWEDIREEEENDVSIMPCLKRLVVRDCPNLNSLPRRLLHSRQTPLEYLNIRRSHLLIEQYKSGELGADDFYEFVESRGEKFVSPTFNFF